MKKIIGIIGVVALFNLAGCATEGYVGSHVDPLAERISRLESQVSNLNATADANKVAIKQANDKAQQALEATSSAKVEAAALRAEKAAKEAEHAAGEAQNLEKKSEKIFKLEQKK